MQVLTGQNAPPEKHESTCQGHRGGVLEHDGCIHGKGMRRMRHTQELFDLLGVGRFQTQSSVEELIKTLGEQEEAQVRRTAASLLGKVGGVQAVDVLVAALDDADEQVCAAAVASLGRIGDRRSVSPLCAMLKSECNLRQHAAEALGEIGDPRAVGALIGALGDARYVVRIAAIRALGRIGDRRAIEPLVTVLGDCDSSIRRIAAAALIRIGAPS